jgi:hypothetical protein
VDVDLRLKGPHDSIQLNRGLNLLEGVALL